MIECPKIIQSSARRNQLGISNKPKKTGRSNSGGYGVMYNDGCWLAKIVVDGQRKAKRFSGTPRGYQQARKWYNGWREKKRQQRTTGRKPFIMECQNSFNVVYWAHGKRRVRRFPCHDYDMEQREATLRLARAVVMILSEPELQEAFGDQPITIP